MQNDVLKNKIAPWQEKGRWYHGTFDLNTQKFVADESDAFFNDASNWSKATQSSIAYFFADRAKYHIADSKSIPRDLATNAATANAYLTRITTSASFGVPLGPSSGTGLMDFYVFIIPFD